MWRDGGGDDDQLRADIVLLYFRCYLRFSSGMMGVTGGCVSGLSIAK